jgi:acetyltransferase-like isoleucine patch superfamily enzyme
MPYLTQDEIRKIGFADVGENVQISSLASFYGASRISFGNNVRVDDFVILSAGSDGIQIDNYIHIAAYSSLIGAGKIHLRDFCNLSSRVSIYSSSDDYSGQSMTNPMIPPEFKQVLHGPVTVGSHVIIGCGSVILPAVSIGTGAAVGALSLVNQDLAEFGIYAGSPVRYLKPRSRELLSLEAQFLADKIC